MAEIESDSDEFEKVEMCKSHQKVINLVEYIKLEPDEELEINENYRYSIKVDICDNPGSECNISTKFLKTHCRQRFLNMGVNVMRKGKNEAEIKKVIIPSNCECQYKKFT